MSTAERISDPSTAAAEIGRLYRSKGMPPLLLSRLMASVRERFHLTYGRLAQLSGMTPGVVHHYVSISRDLEPGLQAEVEAGRLRFKVARAISDLPHQRQVEIAGVFARRQMSSVHIERVVKLAKEHPAAPPERLLQIAMEGLAAAQERVESAPACSQAQPGDPCPRCARGRLIVRPELGTRLSYVSCLQCAYEAPGWAAEAQP